MASRSNKKAAENLEELRVLNQRADQNTEDMSRVSIVGEEEEEGEEEQELPDNQPEDPPRPEASLRDIMAEYMEELQVLYPTARHLKLQARRTEPQIKEQFKKLHRFLEEDEKARLAALREEKEQKRRMMKEEVEDMVSYSPVTPDPNTADPVGNITEALSNASIGGEKEGFNSGVHKWEVQIPESHTHWELGLSTESANSKGTPRSQLWCLKYDGHRYSSWSPEGEGDPPNRKNKKIDTLGVRLNEGKLSFMVDTKTIHTFKHSLTERMVPYVHWGRSEDITTEDV